MIQVSDICVEFLMHYTVVTLTDVKLVISMPKNEESQLNGIQLTPAVIHTCPMLP